MLLMYMLHYGIVAVYIGNKYIIEYIIVVYIYFILTLSTSISVYLLIDGDAAERENRSYTRTNIINDTEYVKLRNIYFVFTRVNISFFTC